MLAARSLANHFMHFISHACVVLVRISHRIQPAVKAVFKLTMIIPSHLTAIANMPESSIISLKDGKKKIEFMPSVKMSTYLLAFVVGEFDYIAVSTSILLFLD